jgi:hypothetical protein
MTATRPPAITPSEAEDDPQNECLVCSEGIAITEIFCPACKRRYPTPLLACAEQYDGRVLRYPGEYRVKLITGESFTVHGAKITGDFAELWKRASLPRCQANSTSSRFGWTPSCGLPKFVRANSTIIEMPTGNREIANVYWIV